MCGQDHSEAEARPLRQHAEPFPWHIGAFDAHNHIAERMYSVDDLPSMKAKGLAIMATRTQDQPLLDDLAALHGVKMDERFSGDKTVIVPGYGRHPWFSHELYDDLAPEPTYIPPEKEEAEEEAKGRHYKAVIVPSPEDPAFWNDLPTPKPLSDFLQETRQRLLANPLAMVGEIGLDKPFRLPMQWQPETQALIDPKRTPGGRQRRPLSPYRISMAHQKTVFMAHLRLAGELGRAVSVHGVQVHGILYDALASSWAGHELEGRRAREKKAREARASGKGEQSNSSRGEESAAGGKPFPPRICLHSFSGKADAVRQYLRPGIPAQIFFSFAARNNLASDEARAKTEDAVRAVPEGRILIETDLHSAGDRMDGELEDMYRAVCEMKGWGLEEGLRGLGGTITSLCLGERRRCGMARGVLELGDDETFW